MVAYYLLNPTQNMQCPPLFQNLLIIVNIIFELTFITLHTNGIQLSSWKSKALFCLFKPISLVFVICECIYILFLLLDYQLVFINADKYILTTNYKST